MIHHFKKKIQQYSVINKQINLLISQKSRSERNHMIFDFILY